MTDARAGQRTYSRIRSRSAGNIPSQAWFRGVHAAGRPCSATTGRERSTPRHTTTRASAASPRGRSERRPRLVQALAGRESRSPPLARGPQFPAASVPIRLCPGRNPSAPSMLDIAESAIGHPNLRREWFQRLLRRRGQPSASVGGLGDSATCVGQCCLCGPLPGFSANRSSMRHKLVDEPSCLRCCRAFSAPDQTDGRICVDGASGRTGSQLPCRPSRPRLSCRHRQLRLVDVQQTSE